MGESAWLCHYQRERDNKQGEDEVVSSALNVLCLK